MWWTTRRKPVTHFGFRVTSKHPVGQIIFLCSVCYYGSTECKCMYFHLVLFLLCDMCVSLRKHSDLSNCSHHTTAQTTNLTCQTECFTYLLYMFHIWSSLQILFGKGRPLKTWKVIGWMFNMSYSIRWPRIKLHISGFAAIFCSSFTEHSHYCSITQSLWLTKLNPLYAAASFCSADDDWSGHIRCSLIFILIIQQSYKFITLPHFIGTH